MKVLIDVVTDKIKGIYDPPLNFDMSGVYIIDIPDSLGVAVKPPMTDAASVIAAKLSAIADATTLIDQEYDELLDGTKVDSALSSLLIVGPKKRTTIMPDGILMTTVINVVTSPVTTLNVQWHCFPRHRDTGLTASKPSPSRVLYGYNTSSSSFVEATTDLEVSLWDSIGTTQIVAPFSSGVDFSAPSSPLSCRLRFRNISSVPIHLSSWVMASG